MECKHCAGIEYVKDGYVKGKQRYKCKLCSKVFSDGDRRSRYSEEKRVRVVKWSLENVGIRSIERMEGVPAPTILRWIKKFAKVLRGRISQDIQENEVVNVQIMEIDELYSYCKKNKRNYISGLL